MKYVLGLCGVLAMLYALFAGFESEYGAQRMFSATVGFGGIICLAAAEASDTLSRLLALQVRREKRELAAEERRRKASA